MSVRTLMNGWKPWNRRRSSSSDVPCFYYTRFMTSSMHRSPTLRSWKEVESKWQQRWANEVRGQTESKDMASSVSLSQVDRKKKFYCLAMFPYPSGKLHVGHVRVYTISDCLARLHRMHNFDVLHPIGWDAFGLPAENAAIERGVSAADWTKSNIQQAKRQLQSLGISFDWEKELATCDSSYYKWTQWLFLQMHKAGLAYRKEATVNWDPVDNTVLANEQVDAEGRSWRSGALVEKRKMKQWFLRISKYADRLLDDIDGLDQWPDAVRRMQQSWIGRSQGTSIKFKVILGDMLQKEAEELEVFTTRADTLFGVKYIAVSPEHSIMERLRNLVPATHMGAVESYLNNLSRSKKEGSEAQPTSSGVPLGIHAVHPFTGEHIPVYAADYVLSEYGSGVVMGVPAHDERDYAFAKYHDISVACHVVESLENVKDPIKKTENAPVFTSRGRLVNSQDFTGLSSEEAISAMSSRLSDMRQGGRKTQFRLRDWLVSRQRYWGAPIPIVHCPMCGEVPVPEHQLPVELPECMQSRDLKGGSERAEASPLSRAKHWKECACPQCGRDATRDTDTLDTFVDSSWYFMRYPDATNDEVPFTKSSSDKWLSHGVDLYVGGIEHAILHLLYSRFITKALYDQGKLPTSEPFKKLLAQGMVLGKTFKSSTNGRYLKPDEIELDSNGQVMEVNCATPPLCLWEKMSKSKYNGVDPETIQSQYGADVTRLAVLFKAPPANELEWNVSDLGGQARWLNRVWSLVDNYIAKRKTCLHLAHEHCDATVHVKRNKELLRKINRTIERTTGAMLQTHSFNVAIAELMKMSNDFGSNENEYLKDGLEAYGHGIEALVTMLAPLAPHNSAEMFDQLRLHCLLRSDAASVHEAEWPQVDGSVGVDDWIQVVVQVRGKTRDTLQVSVEHQNDKQMLEKLALESPVIRHHLGDQAIRKVIVVCAKKQGMHNLVNFVV